jgi:hypothetical protein
MRDSFDYLIRPFLKACGNEVARWLRYSPACRQPVRVPCLDYRNVVDYGITHRPPTAAAATPIRGVLYREPLPAGGVRIIQLFLGPDNQPLRRPDGKPFGRQVVADTLDDELEEYFAGKPVLVVE